MADYQGVFKRYEKKYLLNELQYKTLRQRLESYMEADSYGLHSINNIYYDTDDYRLIRASLEKPAYKEKLRLRSYGATGKDSSVFVEIKKKYDGVVYKRRVAMKLSEADDYILNGNKPLKQTQITREIDWFLNYYKVSPKVFIAYDRIALFGKQDSDLRITFDTNIRFRENKLDLLEGSKGKLLLKDKLILMEIKIPGVMPLMLSRVLDELKIYPVSFSKYGTCYKEHLINKFYIALQNGLQDISENNLEFGGINCA